MKTKTKRAPKPRLTHLDPKGRPGMVDVSHKNVTERTATARAEVVLPPSVLALLSGGDLQSKKGPVFQTAILAGTMAAKKTGELIPLCHPLALEGCRVDIVLQENVAIVTCEVRITHKTGVEMEALTGATIAALTLYDMCKALSHDIEIRRVRLLAKTGGKSDYRAAP
ncbi:MAG: cyclic pyranopterin monophosphate synthase MoaC [Kiritimatiellia bacterium]